MEWFFVQLEAFYKLVYPLDLPVDGQVIQGRAGGALMSWHVHTDQVQVLWKELDQGEPHILVRREAVEHEDGRFVPRPATEGIAELIVFMANVADLHTQSPPPVPIIDFYQR